MNPSAKVLWGEGLFLRPQHFQRQDAYHEWRTAESLRLAHPYAWGVRRLTLDRDALSNGVLRFEAIQLAFPDGELFSAPQEDELPAPRSLGDLPAGLAELTVHVGLPALRPHASNVAAAQEARADVRYVQHDLPAADWFTGAAPAELSLLRRRLQVVLEGEPRDGLVSLPVARLRRAATGNFEWDASFVPPSVSLAAAPPLQALLRRLLDALQAKVDALYGYHREPSKHVIEFRSGDIASFWLLHTASSAFAGLSHLHHQPALHPERLHERLLELAGGLMTFSRRYSLADLPAYQHSAPTAGFARLESIIRDLLDTVISTRCFELALEESKPSFHQARLESERITASTQLVLAVQATMAPADLVQAVPLRFKVGAPDDVDKLVLSAMSGLRLTHAAQVPAAIPVKPGHYYFLIDAKSPLYERMLQAQSLTLYAPSGIPDLSLSLFALNG